MVNSQGAGIAMTFIVISFAVIKVEQQSLAAHLYG